MISYYMMTCDGKDVLFVPGCLALISGKKMIKVDYDPQMLAQLNELLIKNQEYTQENIKMGLEYVVDIDDELIKEFNDFVIDGLDDKALEKARDVLDFVKEALE